MALFSADDITYPPLDVPKPVADGVWIVDSGPLRVFGLLGLPIRMTALQLSSGDMLLHSPTRFDARLKAEIEAHGPIRHLVAPNIAHWSFLAEWQRQCPDAVTWAAPGLRERANVKASDVRLDRDLPAESPPEWAQDLEQAVIPGAAGFREVTFFHRPSRTLVLTDLVVNLEAGKLPLHARAFAWATGVLAPDGKAPAYLRLIVKRRAAAAREAARRLVALDPERVIFAHGRWFERNGAAQLHAHSAGFCADRARWLRFRRGGSRLALTEGSKRIYRRHASKARARLGRERIPCARRRRLGRADGGTMESLLSMALSRTPATHPGPAIRAPRRSPRGADEVAGEDGEKLGDWGSKRAQSV